MSDKNPLTVIALIRGISVVHSYVKMTRGTVLSVQKLMTTRRKVKYVMGDVIQRKDTSAEMLTDDFR